MLLYEKTGDEMLWIEKITEKNKNTFVAVRKDANPLDFLHAFDNALKGNIPSAELMVLEESDYVSLCIVRRMGKTPN